VLGNAFAMRIASGVESSESSVIVDVAMQGTALFSSWFTFEKQSNHHVGTIQSAPEPSSRLRMVHHGTGQCCVSTFLHPS
jgi:hypothetical protein